MTTTVRVSCVILSVPGLTTGDPGHQLLDLTLCGLIQDLVAPSQLTGPYGDGHVDVIFRDPPPDWDATEVMELIQSVIG